MYQLSKEQFRLDGGCNVMLVGCGGTGGFVAEGLCRLLPPRWGIILVDFDLVEPHNLMRQSFYPGDVGRFKSQVLAERLAGQFGREITFMTGPFTRRSYSWGQEALLGHPDLLIGCVDNALARTEIANAINTQCWWVDAGNDENWGQVLVGNCTLPHLGHGFNPDTQICYKLPLPSVQFPTLLLPELAPTGEPDCAEEIDAGTQSATINQIMAATVLEVTRRLITGTCPWMALHLDMDLGVTRPTYATPETVSWLSGLSLRQLQGSRRTIYGY